MVGIDHNLDNVTLAGTNSQVQRYDLSRATVIKSRCRTTKRRFHRDDVKARNQIFTKYRRLERARVGWLLRNVSANIVLQAKLKRQAIVMEDPKGIRKLYRKGNGQGAEYRSRLNCLRDWRELNLAAFRYPFLNLGSFRRLNLQSS